MKKNNQTLREEKSQLEQFKQQTDTKIENIIKNNASNCYLTFDDIHQYRQQDNDDNLVVVNAPYNSHVKMHQKPKKVKLQYTLDNYLETYLCI